MSDGVELWWSESSSSAVEGAGERDAAEVAVERENDGGEMWRRLRSHECERGFMSRRV